MMVNIFLWPFNWLFGRCTVQSGYSSIFKKVRREWIFDFKWEFLGLSSKFLWYDYPWTMVSRKNWRLLHTTWWAVHSGDSFLCNTRTFVLFPSGIIWLDEQDSYIMRMLSRLYICFTHSCNHHVLPNFTETVDELRLSKSRNIWWYSRVVYPVG